MFIQFDTLYSFINKSSFIFIELEKLWVMELETIFTTMNTGIKAPDQQVMCRVLFYSAIALLIIFIMLLILIL